VRELRSEPRNRVCASGGVRPSIGPFHSRSGWETIFPLMVQTFALHVSQGAVCAKDNIWSKLLSFK